jgi:hypothetical protein
MKESALSERGMGGRKRRGGKMSEDAREAEL